MTHCQASLAAVQLLLCSLWFTVYPWHSSALLRSSTAPELPPANCFTRNAQCTRAGVGEAGAFRHVLPGLRVVLPGLHVVLRGGAEVELIAEDTAVLPGDCSLEDPPLPPRWEAEQGRGGGWRGEGGGGGGGSPAGGGGGPPEGGGVSTVEILVQETIEARSLTTQFATLVMSLVFGACDYNCIYIRLPRPVLGVEFV